MQSKILKGLTLYGAGGHCKVVIDILAAIGKQVRRVMDDSPSGDNLVGIPLEKHEDSNIYENAIITIGNCAIRKKIVESVSVRNWLTAVYPSAIVSPSAAINEGTVVMQGAVIQAFATIGRHCIVNTMASVDHDVRVHDFVHVASGATICGGAEIGACTWIGAGTVVKQGIRIGTNCMIGAGSVVVKDIPDNVVAYGNPCKVIRYNN